MLTPVPRKKAKTASAVIFLCAMPALEFSIEIETTQFDYKLSFQPFIELSAQAKICKILHNLTIELFSKVINRLNFNVGA